MLVPCSDIGEANIGIRVRVRGLSFSSKCGTLKRY